MIMRRSGGVLAHPTSFPGPYGIGDLGAGAYAFVDFLKEAGQTLWQILPLGPTSYGDSPYQSFSTFAGNPYLISPDELAEQNYLTERDLAEKPAFNPRSIDYGEVITYKNALLRKAYESFKVNATRQQKTLHTRFLTQNKDWLDNFALFAALKNHFIELRKHAAESEELTAYREANANYLSNDEINDYFYGAVWNSWPAPLAKRQPAALAEMGRILADEIAFIKFQQFEFFRQWGLLKAYANKNGVSVIGDIPIFVAMDSSDVWAAPDHYCLDADGRPTLVAGVPPDYFSETGQLWGNPQYDWETHKKTGYAWWTRRVGSALNIVDILRIDHFRGFEAYWAVPYGEKTAVKGKWLKGPGKELFAAMQKKLGDLPIIAEDLGVITDRVNRLRNGLSLPGMKVLQFSFDPDGSNPYSPHNYTDTRSVVYTGTHDNDTTAGWYASAPERERDYLRRYLNVSGENAAWDLIRLAWSSTAAYAITPVQDLMNLGTEDRMNLPGVTHGCWKFRYTGDMLTDEIAERLAYLSRLFYRLDAAPKPLPKINAR